MKIAIMSFYSGINQRGVERWVYDLASRLWVKHQVTVFQNKEPIDRTNYSIKTTKLKYDTAKISNNQFLNRLFLDYSSLKILFFTIKILPKLFKENYDIVIPTDGGWEPALVRILTWIKRKKMVIVGHAGIGWDDTNNLWTFPDVFVALSSYAKKWAEKRNSRVRIVYIPDAVDTAFFKPEGEKISLNLKSPIVLCVSALEKGKRVDLVIRAVSLIKNCSLLLCGRGTLDRKLQKLGKKLLGNRFKLKRYGFEKMPMVYRTCNLLVSASNPLYSFEMVLLEGMACGLTVVANDDPIRREIVSNAGYIVNVTNIKEFSEAINKALRQSSQNISPIQQAKKYSWDIIFQKYLELFEEISAK